MSPTLTAALKGMHKADQATRAEAAVAAARQYGWDRVGSETAALYRRVLSARSA